MNAKKVKVNKEWGTAVNVSDVRAFLGFANFYRRFHLGYSSIVALLSKLTGKNVPLKWTANCESALQKIKTAFSSAPILCHFDPERQCIIETEASDYVSAGVLSQYNNQNIVHPVTFFYKKHSPAQCNYEIYNKELMAIIRSFEKWRSKLESSPHVIEVLSDHRNLEYFMSTKLLSR